MKERIGLDTVNVENEILNEDTKEIIKLRKNKLYDSEKVNINGFLVLPFGHSDINNYTFTNRDSNRILQKYGLIGKITEITDTTDTNKNWESQFNWSSKIYINKSNCVPRIDNEYTSVKVIDKDTISIETKFNLIKPGNHGLLYSLNTIKYDKYNVTFDKKNNINIKLEGEKKKGNIEYPKLYIFKNINPNNNKEKWENILKEIIPSIDNIISLEHPY